MNTALIVIDVQNDYFPQGRFPLWNAEAALNNIVRAVGRARAAGLPVILVQHVADSTQGGVGFFVEGSAGAEIHPALRAAAPEAPVVVKHFADAFKQTTLGNVLERLGTRRLLLCGMQTQNCVGLTAISKRAAGYAVSVLADCCTAPTEMVHRLACAGFGDWVPMADSQAALGEE